VGRFYRRLGERRKVQRMATPELSGVSIVGAGTFNPAILHPQWLAEKGLIPEDLAEDAMRQDAPQSLVVSPQLAVFVGDWLSVQVTPQQAIFLTVDQGRELDLRDLVRGVFELLPETPIDALGINSDTHFRTESEGAWHAFGDRFLPKQFWEPLFEDGSWRKRPDGKRVGMRMMTVEVNRDDEKLPGFVRVEVAPSVRVTPNGVYIGINNHFELKTEGDRRANAEYARRVLVDHWQEARDLETKLVAQLLEAV
jgi:hypothetical protein